MFSHGGFFWQSHFSGFNKRICYSTSTTIIAFITQQKFLVILPLKSKGYISDFNFYQGKFRSMSNISHIKLMKQCKNSMHRLSMWEGRLYRNSLVSRLDDHLANDLSWLKTLYLYLHLVLSFDNHFAHVSTRKHSDKSLRKLLEALDNCLPGQMLP